MSEVPAEQAAILDVMPLVGRVLETNYGLTFDVRSVAQPDNLAYSDLGLGLHTDNPYREPVPGFQALHALIPSMDGGASLFADGFALAEHLRATAPEHFRKLTLTPVPFLYRSKDAELYAERPLIQLSVSGQVTAVHYNSRSIAPLALPAAEADELLRSLSALRRPDARCALPADDALGQGHAGGVRQPAHPAWTHRILLGQAPAPPARLLSHARQRLQRSGAAAPRARARPGAPHEPRRGDPGAVRRARRGRLLR